MSAPGVARTVRAVRAAGVLLVAAVLLVALLAIIPDGGWDAWPWEVLR